MVCAFLCALFALRALVPRVGSARFTGCANASDSAAFSFYAPPGAHEPLICASGCVDGGVDQPAGDGRGNLALDRTEGPLLHNISVGSSTNRVHAGKTSVAVDSGNLAAGRPDRPRVRICAERQAYSTNTDITFLAVTDVPDPAEIIWYFGDSSSTRTKSKTVAKRYRTPGRYDVVAVASDGRTAVTSGLLSLVVQRAVRLNRLVHRASVLQNQTVTVRCRVSEGTDVAFKWSFGDGASRLGRSTEQHVYRRMGEFRLEVTVFNRVSSASLSGHIFVVDRPCQPPPVKNMGPLKLQVRRHEAIRLGVTYETDLDCDVSDGLYYTWNLHDSADHAVPLPLMDTHRQSITLPGHFLHYGSYTATARVEVVGSVVRSSYSVKVQVIPRPPVASIQGGTNIFVNSKNVSVITLDGQRSYDPDFPVRPISYSWTCKPLSAIVSSCFDRDVPTSVPVFTFPAGSLNQGFDQFQFTLTVHSGRGSASATSFLSITSSVTGKVSVYCPQCQGDHVNWDQALSVSASCDDCSVSPKPIRYTWSLYLVNASSKPVRDVPFCYTVDLGAPSTILEGPASSRRRFGAPTLHPVTTESSADVHISTANKQALSRPDRNMAAGLMEPEPVPPRDSSPASIRPKAAGEEPYYHPLGEFDPPEPLNLTSDFTLDNDGVLYSDHFSRTDVSDLTPDFSSSVDWDSSFPLAERVDLEKQDYDVPFPGPEEGEPGLSAGRPTGADAETFGPGGGSVFDPAREGDEGSHLVESRPSVVLQQPTVLDLPRDPVDRVVFESYTYNGIASPLLSLRPFSLRPDSRYMLEVTAKLHDSLLGRTQLFLRTNPAPTGVTCQVQPIKGAELHTYFSIFCTSGKEDLLYEYSFSKGDGPPRILYRGRDFQYYFHLPAGDPSNDYKVTIYIQIRSSRHGSTTKPCPVTVQVRPSFLRDNSDQDPDLELADSGLRNLSALVQLGNSAEICNYVSLLADILNRLSLNTEANAEAQTRTRNTLIRTMCELDSLEQALMVDTVYILKELLQVTSQVTLMSVRRVRTHVQAIVDRIPESGPPHRYHVDRKTLSTLVTLLSYGLQAAATRDFTGVTSDRADVTETDPAAGGHEGNNTGSAEPTGARLKQEADSARRLVADVQQTASDLILKYLLVQQTQEHRVNTGLMSLCVTHQNRSSTPISGASASVRIPASLIRLLFDGGRGGRPCVLTLLTELAVNPYAWSRSAAQPSGPVVELSLYECGTRRKILLRSLLQPLDIELQQAPRNRGSAPEYVLPHRQVNYHSFNITHEHLHRAIQLSVAFPPAVSETFPIMLLFRMFQKPSPSMHHVSRIHRWTSNTARISLPSNYLSAAGVGYLALLNAEFEKPLRYKYTGDPVRYTLTLDTSLCLSWDDQQGAWTRHGCRTKQTDTKTAVSCSCDQLRPLMVAQQQIQSSQETLDVDPFFSILLRSLSPDLTLLAVVLLCVGLYVPALVLCRRADAVSEKNQRVHYLPDNCPSDRYLYAVTVHTGLWSAARMSAKVYIVLCGEDGFSQTRELHVPGCIMFRRNFRNTFILSTADSLGPLWGVHIWHDNSGPSPNWYLKQVAVSEVNRENVKSRSWLFLAECWLDVSKSDGRVERTLRVCSQGLGFTQILRLKLCDYLTDFHLWICVYACPRPTAFTHTQRLAVCLLLLSGYACVNALLISQMDEQLPFTFGIIDVSAVSVTTGAFGVMAVLPVATMLSFLFRLREVELMGSRVERIRSRKSENGFLKVLQKVKDPLVRGRCGFEEGGRHQAARSGHSGFYQVVTKLRVSGSSAGFRWCHRLAWLLCLLLSVSCLLLAAALGMRFSSGKVLVWTHSLFFSLLSCIFFIQPVTIVAVAAVVSLSFRDRTDFCNITQFEMEPTTVRSRDGARGPEEPLRPPAFHQQRGSTLEKLLRARQRARFLHHVRPPPPAELKRTRRKKRKEALIGRTLRDLTVCVSMCFLMLCVTCSSSFTDHYHLNKAVRKHFLWSQKNSFMSTEKHEDWWKWTQSSLLNLLYNEASDPTKFDAIGQSHIMIGEPVLSKTETSGSFQGRFSLTTALAPESHLSFRSGIRAPTSTHSNGTATMATPLQACGHLGCSSGSSVAVGLGHTKSEAAAKLKLLHSGGWLNRHTAALMIQITLYSPAPDLFTSVTLLTQQSAAGVLLPSAEVQTVRIHRTPTACDYVTMVCQLLFLLLSVLDLSHQMYSIGEQGLMGYCRTPSNWLEVVLQTVNTLQSVLHLRHSSAVMEAAELLQNQSSSGRVDVGPLAAREQCVRTLRGVLLFLLAVKTLTAMKANRTLAASAAVFTRSLCSLFWPTISGFILLMALSSVGNLIFIQTSWAFGSLPHSLQTVLCHLWGLKSIKILLTSGRDLIYQGAVHLSSTMVWTAMAMGVVMSWVRITQRSHSRRDVFTLADLTAYIRRRVSVSTGRKTPTWSENHMETKTYYLEECESLVDELLFRLGVLTNNPHRRLPPKAYCYRKDSPLIGPRREPSSVGSQAFLKSAETAETAGNRDTDVSLPKSPPPHLLRSELEWQRGPRKSRIDVSDLPQQTGARAEEIPKVRGQLYSEGQGGAGTEGHLPVRRPLALSVKNRFPEMPISCWSTTTDRWLNERGKSGTEAPPPARAACAEVVVEVLVHEEPQHADPHTW